MGDEREGPRWTEAGLRAIQPTGRREEFRDPTMPALVLLMTPAGAKTFYLVYRAGGGRRGPKRWFKIGRFGQDLGLATARAEALKVAGQVAAGADPQADRRTGRQAGLTVADLCDRFETDYLDRGAVAASTAVFYRDLIERQIRPKLGRAPLAAVTSAEVAGFLREVPPASVRKAAATLSRMFNRAELWGLREPGRNPVRGQDLPAPVHRTLRFTDDQLRALGPVLADPGMPWQPRAMVALLLLTGMRASELAGNAKYSIPPRPWEDVDLARGVLWLRQHKTVKRIGARPVYLCAPARTVLEGLPREGPLILGGWENMRWFWPKIRDKAELGTLRIHDLRHTYSSVGDDLGLSEATRGALLGHAASSQTARYTHKLSTDLAAAAESIGARLWDLLGLESAPPW